MISLTMGERIEELMRESGGSVTVDAKKIGTSQCTLSDIINDKRENISSSTLIKMCKHYNVSADYILGLSEVKTRNETIRSVCEYTGLSEEAIKLLHGKTLFLDKTEAPGEQGNDAHHEEIWKEMCDSDKAWKTQFLSFINGFISSKEIRSIISCLNNIAKEIECYEESNSLVNGNLWAIQTQINVFLEQYLGIDEARQKYEKRWEE